MSGLVMGSVLKYSQSRGNSRLVLLVIGDFAQDDGSGAWPAIGTIAKRAGISERTAQRALRDLVELGELAIEENAGPKGSNLYNVIMARLRGDKLTGVSLGAQGGDKSDAQGVTRVTPDPSSGSLLPDPPIYPRFQEFFELYPRKTAKKDALRAWIKLKPSSELFTKIMARLKVFVEVDWANREKDRMPHPATWINGKRWEDEIVQPTGVARPQSQLFTEPEERPFVPIPILKPRKKTPEELQAEEQERHAAWLDGERERLARLNGHAARNGVS